MTLTNYTKIENIILKPKSVIHIKEDIDGTYIERVYSDILTFLKNVNRLKDNSSFFELLEYWIYWRNEEFSVFEKKISGKGTAYSSEWHDATMVGKIINRLDKSIAGLFYVDSKDIEKYLRKKLNSGESASPVSGDINVLNNVIDYALRNGERLSDSLTLILKRTTYSEEDAKKFLYLWKETYFDVWKSNASSRYISTKKIVDEVFTELKSLFISDHYIEEYRDIEGVRVYTAYEETQIDEMYATIKRVESALSYFKRKDWGKKLIPSLKLAIDFVSPEKNFKFQTSYGMSQSAGVYLAKDRTVVISKQRVVSDFIFEILAHELGHKFYYEIMNPAQRKEWENLYDSLKTGSNMEEYKKALLFFSDNLLSMKETYKKNLRKSSSNFSSYTKDFGSVKSYFDLIDEIYFKNKHGTILTDFIYDYSTKDFKYGFELDSLYTIVNARVEGEARRGNINITSNYDGYELLNPATIEVVNGKILEVFKESLEAEGRSFIKNFPTQYAGENASELFAETFAANGIKSLNIDFSQGKEMKVSEFLYDKFRAITGIREKTKRNK